LLAFALFRCFDILKPWPINWLDERVHGGFGVMLDDLLAALYAVLVLLGLVWLFPSLQ
jgi:phosphatidylglycerophosphatase A